MAPGEVVSTGEVNVYQGQLFHVMLPFYLTCYLTVAHCSLGFCLQLADRTPFAGGPLDPRLVSTVLELAIIPLELNTEAVNVYRELATDQPHVRHVARS